MKRLFTIILSLSMLLLVACGGTTPTGKLYAANVLGGDTLEIKIKVPKYFPEGLHETYFIKKDLKGMKEVFDNAEVINSTLTTKIYQDKWLFIQKEIFDKVFYYQLMLKSDNGVEFCYRYSSAFTYVGDDIILVPLHLMANWNSKSNYEDIIIDTQYEIVCQKQEFIDFYKGCFAYDVRDEENSLIVNVKEDELLSRFHTRKNFKITFEEIDEKLNVSYSFLE